MLGESPSDTLIVSIRKTAQKASKQPLYLHHIHIHNYGQHPELSCHIKLPPQMTLDEAHEICTLVEKTIEENFGYISTIHPEPITWKNPTS